MKPSEHSAKTPSAKTGGLFATLCNLLPARGSGAPSPSLFGFAPSRLASPEISLGRPASRRLLLTPLALAAALLALAATPALAATHGFKTSFGSAGTGDGGLALRAAGIFVAGSGLAVNQESGDLYVADTENHRVDQFDAAGNFIRAFGANVGGAGVGVCASGCVAGTSTSAAGGFQAPAFVAVDNSAGASKGDVYVADSGDNLVSKFDPEGQLISSWGNNGPLGTPNGQLNGSTTGAGSFGSLAGVAVGVSGTLHVFNHNEAHMFEFAQEGSFLTEFEAVRGTEPYGLGVDSAGSFFKVNGDFSVEKITAANEDLGQVSPNASGGAHATALAADPSSGDLYITEAAAVQHYAFNGAGEVIEPGSSSCAFAPHEPCGPTDSFGSGHLQGGAGIAVDSASSDVYVADTTNQRIDVFGPITLPDVATKAASGIGAHEATLKGSVNPQGIPLSECFFEYGPADSYGEVAECEPSAAAIGAGSEPVAVEAHISGLEVGTVYHYRLVAVNENGTSEGEDASFETLPKPSIDAAAAENLTEHSVDLTAEVNPRGSETSCQIEWGPTAEPGNPALPYEHTEACNPEQLGSGSADVPVSLHLEGLTANTSYHWRVSATNPSGTTKSFDHTFIDILAEQVEGNCPNETFRSGPSAALPDCRAYEQVTPTAKNGALPGGNFYSVLPEPAADGSRFYLASTQCFALSVSCPALRVIIGSPFAFARGEAGWSTEPLSPPASAQAPVNTTVALSPDSGESLVLLPTAGGHQDLFVRSPGGSLGDVGPAAYSGAAEQSTKGESQAYTADLSHLVFGVQQNFWPFDRSEAGSLYEYAGRGNEQPFLVGVRGGERSTELLSQCATALGGASRAESGTFAPGRLSSDGRIVYFTAIAHEDHVGNKANCLESEPAPPANTLYARVDGESEAAHTVLISGRSPSECSGECATSPPSAAEFEGASEDGSLAYFTSTQQLTDVASEDAKPGDSAAAGQCSTHSGEIQNTGPNGCNLYRYDLGAPTGHELTAVSAGDTSGGGPQVQGTMAISNDGSHVYFVARGVLAGPNGEGKAPAAGADNLYLYRRDAAHPGGQRTFVATLAGADQEQWQGEGGGYANVSPDGRFLVFASAARLSPDSGAGGVLRLFRYDAATEALSRVSIGERGFNDNGNSATDPNCQGVNDCPEGAKVAWPRSFSGVGVGIAGPARRDPTMSNDGSRIFFTSPLALTPGALDQLVIADRGGEGKVYAQNLYEWEAQGSGGCGQAEGCVRLISDGRDTTLSINGVCGISSAVCLAAASSDGRDVFFSTADRLTPSDTDTQIDYYDARVGGGFAESANVTPCGTADACSGQGGEEGPASPPATPNFSGPEEGPRHPQKPRCRRGFLRKHGRCLKPRGHHKRGHRRRAGANREGTR